MHGLQDYTDVTSGTTASTRGHCQIWSIPVEQQVEWIRMTLLSIYETTRAKKTIKRNMEEFAK